MITAARSDLLVAVLCCCAALVGAEALAQEESAPEPDATTTPSDVDEIVVIGRTPAEIRAQIKAAEEAVYDRFNEINSDDEFDIHCRQEAPTGSHIKRRVCQANFWRTAQARAGEETVRAMQGSPSIPAASFLGQAMQKGHVMVDEMRRLALQDEQFQKALVRLGTLTMTLKNKSPAEESSVPRASTATILTGGGLGEPLPYGAAVVAQVQIGRRPWRFDLTEPTFALAQVSGEIEEMGIECRGQEEELQYEPDAEWTLPADWSACRLHVGATRGTTFMLYEFE